MFHSNIFIYVNAILLSFVLAKSLLNVFTQQRLCHMFHFRNSSRRSFTLLLASTGERYMNPFHLDNFVIWIFRTKANTKTKVEMYCVTSDLLLRLEIARVAIFGWLYCIYSVYTHRTKCVCVCVRIFFLVGLLLSKRLSAHSLQMAIFRNQNAIQAHIRFYRQIFAKAVPSCGGKNETTERRKEL